MQDRDNEEGAFGFEGTWQEFAPIAFTNLLLTIVTLGIYRFWATARERRYLWSRSRFIDERLEWSGTGLELFIGALLVLFAIVLPLFLLSQLAQALVMRGQEGAGVLLTFTTFVLVFYLIGVARFRALRYRLSRTRWHGIRGGSDDQGLGYGLSYMWKTIIGYLPASLLVPWSMTSLWNERWSKMSFGPFDFEADAQAGPVFARYLLFYLSPIVLFLGLGAAAVMGGGVGMGIAGDDGTGPGVVVGFILALIIWFLGLGLIAVAFYAKYYREVVGATRLKRLQFHFEASSMDWIKLYLGDFALVLFTLGIGWIFLSYRHWKFFITHMEATGEIRLDELTQSTTRMAGHGEGLLDAFDIGAI